MKILIDMNLPPRWVDMLAKAGIEAEHWSAIGRPDATDREIMAYAVVNGQYVLTLDLDFGSILAATQGNKPSVVQIRANGVDIAEIGESVAAALWQMQSELAAGALLTIDPKRTRIRLLPLRQ